MSPSTLDEQALRERISDFLDHHALLVGDEKGEAQVFLDRFFQALGHRGVKEAGAVLEDRVRGDGSVHFADLMWDDVVLFEMKKRGEDLKNHYTQAERYWLEKTKGRPRYVVTCNFDEFWIYDFDHQLYQPVDVVPTARLADRWEAFGFMLPKPIEPLFDQNLEEVSKSAAASIAGMVSELIDSGVERQRSQRFAMQCVTAMFAEDTGLIPRHLFTRAVVDADEGKIDAYDAVFGLFREMNTPGITSGGRFEGTPYFNGDLYADSTPFHLPDSAVATLKETSALDWAKIQPEIFGTLFERFLDSDRRHALGAHFTTAVDIMRVVRPTIVDPYTKRIKAARSQKALGAIETELTQLRVLDPACGSGNFLYVAYRELRKLEALIEDRRNELSTRKRSRSQRLALVSPDQFFGIDIDPFAVEIARITLLIAKQLTAFERSGAENPLPLDKLDQNIVVGDALFDEWPAFQICIGNPPYLGRQRMLQEYGADYLNRLGDRFPDVGGFADYVAYWFRLAHEQMPADGRSGLVATNTIRQGATRQASLDYVLDNGGRIFDAWPSIPWSGEAGVSVSIVNWSKEGGTEPGLLHLSDDSAPTVATSIAGDLSAHLDLRSAASLSANANPKVFFQGQTTGHMGFVLTASKAREIVQRSPSEATAIHPYVIGEELLHDGAPSRWLIDIAADDATDARARFPLAIGHLESSRHVERGDTSAYTVREKRTRKANEERERNDEALLRNPSARVNWHHRNFLNRWWQLSYRRESFLDAISDLDRFIVVTAHASENRRPIFTFLSTAVRPSHALQCFALDDDYSLGVLQSQVHELWFRRRCSTLEERLRYTTKTVFGSFPWPQSISKTQSDNVVRATADLLTIREDRLRAGLSLADQYASMEEPGRNKIRDAQEALDKAVLDAYGFSPKEDPVAQLLELNLASAEREVAGKAVAQPGPPAGFADTRATDVCIPAPIL